MALEASPRGAHACSASRGSAAAAAARNMRLQRRKPSPHDGCAALRTSQAALSVHVADQGGRARVAAAHTSRRRLLDQSRRASQAPRKGTRDAHQPRASQQPDRWRTGAQASPRRHGGRAEAQLHPPARPSVRQSAQGRRSLTPRFGRQASGATARAARRRAAALAAWCCNATPSTRPDARPVRPPLSVHCVAARRRRSLPTAAHDRRRAALRGFMRSWVAHELRRRAAESLLSWQRVSHFWKPRVPRSDDLSAGANRDVMRRSA